MAKDFKCYNALDVGKHCKEQCGNCAYASQSKTKCVRKSRSWLNSRPLQELWFLNDMGIKGWKIFYTSKHIDPRGWVYYKFRKHGI